MRTLAGGLIVAAGVCAAGTAAAQDKVAAGAKVFEAQKCAMCHSVEGKGNKKYPLDGVGAKLGEADIKLWIVDPRAAEKKFSSTAKPPMKPYAALPAGDLDSLVAYLMSLNKK